MFKYEFADVARKGEVICMNESMYNHGLKMHTHDFFEITYILKGKGLYTQNRKTSVIAGGDLVMVSPADIHRFEPLTHDFRWINCIFLPHALCANDSPTLSELLSIDSSDPANTKAQFTGLHEIFLCQKAEVFSHIFSDMQNEYVNARPGYDDVMQMQLRLIIKKICYAYKPEPSSSDETGLTSEALKLLVQSFFRSGSSYSKISLASIAKKAHVTPKYFSDIFKKKTGVCLSEYIRDMRLSRAAELLQTIDANIDEIMHYVGYNDSKFFYRIFKDKYGVTPAVYRKNNAKKHCSI